jgi:hypothetical protein
MLLAERAPVTLGALASEPPLAPEEVRGLAVDGDVADAHIGPFMHVGGHAAAPRTDTRFGLQLDEDLHLLVGLDRVKDRESFQPEGHADSVVSHPWTS